MSDKSLSPFELLLNANREKLATHEFDLPIEIEGKPIKVMFTIGDFEDISADEEIYYQMYLNENEAAGNHKREINNAEWDKYLETALTVRENVLIAENEALPKEKQKSKKDISDQVKIFRDKVIDTKPGNLAIQVARKQTKDHAIFVILPKYLRNVDGSRFCPDRESQATLREIMACNHEVKAKIYIGYIGIATKNREINSAAKNS